MNVPKWPVPRLQVFGWQAFEGRRTADLPCLLDLQGVSYTTSGRAAITLALEGLGVSVGDTVLVPSYHCPTMVAPASQLGAKPLFYPLDFTGQPKLDWLEARLHSGMKAMIAAHFFGLPQPMFRLRKWCDSHGIALIEDCAHALFGHAEGRTVGAWGHAAIGSLTKFLPVSVGGCVRFESERSPVILARSSAKQEAKALLDIVEEGARHGRLGLLNALVTVPLRAVRRRRVNIVKSEQPRTESQPLDAIEAGFAIDMPLAHQRLALACKTVALWLPRARIVERRRLHYQRLVAELSNVPGVRPLMPGLPDGAAPYVLPLWVDRPDPGYLRLRSQGVPVFRWDRPWPDMPVLSGDSGPGWAEHVIQLGCHQDLSEDDMSWIIHQVRECCSSKPGRLSS